MKKTAFLVICFLIFSSLPAYSLPVKSYEDWYLTQEALAGKLWEGPGKSRAENFLVKETKSLPFDSRKIYFAQQELSIVVEYAYRRGDSKKLDDVVSLLLPSSSWLESVSLESTDGHAFLADCWLTTSTVTYLAEEVSPGAKSIKLQDVSSLPDSGRVLIEGEVVSYREKDERNNLLLGLKIKGYHSAGAKVYQLSENVLCSAQFVYLLARTLNVICSLPPSQRSDSMKTFLTDFTPIITSHLYRWQYRQSIKWWGNSFIPPGSHYQKLMILYSGKYNSRTLSLLRKRVSDTDLWIVASTAELLDSSLKDPYIRHYLERRAPGSTNSYFSLMERYLKLGFRLVKQRTEVNIPGFLFIFDRGTRKDHPDHLYARFFEEPTRTVIGPDGSVYLLPRILSSSERNLYKDANATFDISHGMRLPLVFLTLYRCKNIVKESFPDSQVMKALGAQFYEKVYSRNFSKPLFRVYLNGINGWYRVNYNRGYGPWGLSHTVFYGYYSLLIPFEPRLKEITQSLTALVKDEEKKRFVLTYYSKVCDEDGKIESHFYSKLIFGSCPVLNPPRN